MGVCVGVGAGKNQPVFPSFMLALAPSTPHRGSSGVIHRGLILQRRAAAGQDSTRGQEDGRFRPQAPPPHHSRLWPLVSLGRQSCSQACPLARGGHGWHPVGFWPGSQHQLGSSRCFSEASVSIAEPPGPQMPGWGTRVVWQSHLPGRRGSQKQWQCLVRNRESWSVGLRLWKDLD